MHCAELPRETPEKCLRKSSEELEKSHVFGAHLTTTSMQDLFKGCQLLQQNSSFLTRSHTHQKKKGKKSCTNLLNSISFVKIRRKMWKLPRNCKVQCKKLSLTMLYDFTSLQQNQQNLCDIQEVAKVAAEHIDLIGCLIQKLIYNVTLHSEEIILTTNHLKYRKNVL